MKTKIIQSITSGGLALVMACSMATTSFAFSNPFASLLKPFSSSSSTTTPSASITTTNDISSTDMYYRNQLSGAELTAYDAVVKGIQQRQDSIVVPNDVANSTSLSRLTMAVFNDHPEFYYTERKLQYRTHSTYATSNGVKTKTSQETTYSPTYNSYKNVSQSTIDQAINNFLKDAPINGTDAEKEKYVHDKLVKETTYELNSPKIYDCLVRHQSNCEGYSFTTKLLLNKLGVSCRVMDGNAINSKGKNESHMWNVITISGQDYALDVTWDDPTGAALDNISYKYYNLSKADMGKDHFPNNATASAWNHCSITDSTVQR